MARPHTETFCVQCGAATEGPWSAYCSDECREAFEVRDALSVGRHGLRTFLRKLTVRDEQLLVSSKNPGEAVVEILQRMGFGDRAIDEVLNQANELARAGHNIHDLARMDPKDWPI